MGAHPLAVVAVGASLIAIGHAIWIWTHRHVGALDPDEAGYIAASLRMHRTLLSPVDLVRTIGGTGNGITTPLISVPLLVIGPRDPRMAMMSQPILMAVSAVSVAGIVRRTAGPYAAIGAGLLFALLPTTALATQSYWYGLSAAAFMLVAVWALVASERGDNRLIWVFGLAVGAMWLSRTMTLGYAPAMLVAGVAVVGFERRRLLRLAGSLALAVLVAAPWYLANRSSIFGYLVSYGYGERASHFGHGDVLERTIFRIDRMSQAFGDFTWNAMWIAALAAVVFSGWRVLQRHGTGGGDVVSGVRRWLASERGRVLGAVGGALLIGTAALVSTSNNGVWFELPMVGLAVVLLAGILGSGPSWLGGSVAVVIAVPLLLSQSDLWWLRPWHDGRQTSHYESGFEQYDDRFGPRSRHDHRTAAREWADLSDRVLEAVRPGDGRPYGTVVTVSGNMQLFNTNTLALSGELHGWIPRARVPDTADPPSERSRELTPSLVVDGRRTPRVLVIADHDKILFTPDLDVEGFSAQARRVGWRISERIPMPSGGDVLILQHPESP